jgi:lantibiotic modifying enzyme
VPEGQRRSFIPLLRIYRYHKLYYKLIARRFQMPFVSAFGPPKEAPAAGDWIEEALFVGDQIWSHVRRTPGGEIVWLQPPPSGTTAAAPARLRPYLYSGLAGVLLFLSALEHITGQSERRELLLQALSPLRRWLSRQVEEDEAAPTQPWLLGGVAGLGSLVYSLPLIGRWLEVPELLQEAAEAASLITPERIGKDAHLDVMSGAAGALLALLTLHRCSPQAASDGLTPLERAVACGEHLLRRADAENGCQSWECNGRAPVCGFAHGATGIAYALACLFVYTGQERFRDAAERGLAFERLHFDPEHKNWRLLNLQGSHFITAWCNGSAGATLGRVGMRNQLGDARIDQEIRWALEAIRDSPEMTRDFVCCGNLGRVEALLQACRQMGEESLGQDAAGIAEQVTQQRGMARGGCYWWFEPGDPRFAPSFFKGAAGIGYTLLRLSCPSLPCVLLLEGAAAR